MDVMVLINLEYYFHKRFQTCISPDFHAMLHGIRLASPSETYFILECPSLTSYMAHNPCTVYIFKLVDLCTHCMSYSFVQTCTIPREL